MVYLVHRNLPIIGSHNPHIQKTGDFYGILQDLDPVYSRRHRHDVSQCPAALDARPHCFRRARLSHPQTAVPLVPAYPQYGTHPARLRHGTSIHLRDGACHHRPISLDDHRHMHHGRSRRPHRLAHVPPHQDQLHELPARLRARWSLADGHPRRRDPRRRSHSRHDHADAAHALCRLCHPLPDDPCACGQQSCGCIRWDSCPRSRLTRRNPDLCRRCRAWRRLRQENPSPHRTDARAHPSTAAFVVITGTAAPSSQSITSTRLRSSSAPTSGPASISRACINTTAWARSC